MKIFMKYCDYNEKTADNLMIVSGFAYPDPGSNRDELPHWCLRPARLPIPPSGLKSEGKGTHLF